MLLVVSGINLYKQLFSYFIARFCNFLDTVNVDYVETKGKFPIRTVYSYDYVAEKLDVT